MCRAAQPGRRPVVLWEFHGSGLDSIFFHDNRSRIVGIAGQQKIPGSVCTVAAAELKGPAPRSQKLEGIWDAGTSFAIICTINFANLNSDSASLSIV